VRHSGAPNPQFYNFFPFIIPSGVIPGARPEPQLLSKAKTADCSASLLMNERALKIEGIRDWPFLGGSQVSNARPGAPIACPDGIGFGVQNESDVPAFIPLFTCRGQVVQAG
jgi:hypothetical protein